MLRELPETLSIREIRLEVNYSAARLNALEETRHLAKDFEEAAEKFALLENEEASLDLQRVETQAMVEIADDAWNSGNYRAALPLYEDAKELIRGELAVRPIRAHFKETLRATPDEPLVLVADGTYRASATRWSVGFRGAV